MSIRIEQFHGIAPRIHPSLLGEGMAVTAHNCRLKTGKLVPLRYPSVAKDAVILMENGLTKIADAKTIHAWKKRDGGIEFVAFPGVTWMAEGNVADDELTRVVFSGETGASFGESKDVPTIFLRNGGGARESVPLPMDELPKPLATRVGDDLDTANIRYTRFFWTWTDAYGRESPVSEPSAILEGGVEKDDDVEYNDGDVVNLASLVSRGGTWPEGAVALRVYKVVTGTEDGRVQFVKEFSKDFCTEGGIPGGAALSFKVKDEDAGEVITMMESAPHDLVCVQKVPGNYYCGFSRSRPKTVMFSDVDLVYSWPSGFQYDVDDNIVTLAVTSNTVFALTDGYPFVLSGTGPDTMTVSKLAGPAACVSARGVCVYKNAVYYVGNAGLMTIYNDANSGTTCANLTDKIFTKEQWQAKNPSSCVMGQFDGALLLFFDLGDGRHEGLCIDLTENMDSVTTHDEIAKCLCVDNRTDTLYFVREV